MQIFPTIRENLRPTAKMFKLLLIKNILQLVMKNQEK